MADKTSVFKLTAVLLGALFLGGIMNAKPRGIRNNNPGNIRGNEYYKWNGEIGRDDEDFIIFATPEDGLRAMARTLRTYRNKHGLQTINGIINRWAPKNGIDKDGNAYENKTESYIQHATGVVGVSRDTPLELYQYPALMQVIVKHENRIQPYTDAQIMEGFNRGFNG